MRTILIPTNFSNVANYATDVAISMAQKNNTHIQLLHIIPWKTNFSLELKINTQLPHEIEPELEQFVKKAYKNFLKIHEAKNKNNLINMSLYLKSITNSNKLIEGIITHEADLIVMGTQEISGYEDEMLIGENTRMLTKESKVPVLCVRNKIKDFEPQKIVFATHFKPSHIDVLVQLKKKFFDAYNAHIYFVYINTPENFSTTRKLTKIFQSVKKNYKLDNISLHIYNDISRGGGIVNFSEDIDADLIIMPTHGRKGLGYFFSGSIAEQVLDESKIPVLTFLAK